MERHELMYDIILILWSFAYISRRTLQILNDAKYTANFFLAKQVGFSFFCLGHDIKYLSKENILANIHILIFFGLFKLTKSTPQKRNPAQPIQHS